WKPAPDAPAGTRSRPATGNRNKTRKRVTKTPDAPLLADLGQTQPRRVSIEGDTLKLGSVSPIQSADKAVMSVLSWRRAEPC
ncbi:hypothetical protein, partial [Cellulomonas fimi]|uniref:hypothetical protein n=1 Tax=Cellulomonas fimi TaxID=1708 RepID=UPI001B866695